MRQFVTENSLFGQAVAEKWQSEAVPSRTRSRVARLAAAHQRPCRFGAPTHSTPPARRSAPLRRTASGRNARQGPPRLSRHSTRVKAREPMAGTIPGALGGVEGDGSSPGRSAAARIDRYRLSGRRGRQRSAQGRRRPSHPHRGPRPAAVGVAGQCRRQALKRKPSSAIALQRCRPPRRGSKKREVGKLAPGVLPGQGEVGEDRAGGDPHRHPPLRIPVAVSRRSPKKAETPPDVRKPVVRQVVLGRPSVLDRVDLEALPSPGLERRVALAGVGLAGLVGLAADHQQLSARGRQRPQRVRRALIAEVHPLGDRATQPGRGDHRRNAAGWLQGEVEAAVRRNGRWVAMITRSACRPRLRARSGTRARSVSSTPTARCARWTPPAAAAAGGDAVEVAQGVEFGLVLDPDGGVDGKRQLVDGPGQLRVQSGFAGCLGLGDDRRTAGLALGVGEVGLANEVAFDPERLDVGGRPTEPRLVGGGVVARRRWAEALA